MTETGENKNTTFKDSEKGSFTVDSMIQSGPFKFNLGARGLLLPTVSFESLSKDNLQNAPKKVYELHERMTKAKMKDAEQKQCDILGPFLSLCIAERKKALDESGQPSIKIAPVSGTAEDVLEHFLFDVKEVIKRIEAPLYICADDIKKVIEYGIEATGTLNASSMKIEDSLIEGTNEFPVPERINWPEISSAYNNSSPIKFTTSPNPRALYRNEKEMLLNFLNLIIVDDESYRETCRHIGFSEQDLAMDDFNHAWSQFTRIPAEVTWGTICCHFPYFPKVSISEAEEAYNRGGLADLFCIINNRFKGLHFDPTRERIKNLKPEEKWDVEMTSHAFCIDFSEKFFSLLCPQPALKRSLWHDNDFGPQSQNFLGFLENCKLEEKRLLYPDVDFPAQAYIHRYKLDQVDPVHIVNQIHFNMYAETLAECLRELNEQREEVEQYIRYRQERAAEWASNYSNASKVALSQGQFATREQRKAAKRFAHKMSKQSKKVVKNSMCDPGMLARKQKMENKEPEAIIAYYHNMKKQEFDLRAANEILRANIQSVMEANNSRAAQARRLQTRLTQARAGNTSTNAQKQEKDLFSSSQRKVDAHTSSKKSQPNSGNSPQLTPVLSLRAQPKQSYQKFISSVPSNEKVSQKRKVTGKTIIPPKKEEKLENPKLTAAAKIKQRTPTPARQKNKQKAKQQEFLEGESPTKLRKSHSLMAIWGSTRDLSEECANMESHAEPYHEKPKKKKTISLTCWSAMKAEIDVYFGDWRDQVQQQKYDNFKLAKDFLSSVGVDVFYGEEEDNNDSHKNNPPYHYDVLSFEKKEKQMEKKNSSETQFI